MGVSKGSLFERRGTLFHPFVNWRRDVPTFFEKQTKTVPFDCGFEESVVEKNTTVDVDKMFSILDRYQKSRGPVTRNKYLGLYYQEGG